jgi:hypothetical protein
MDDVHLYKAQVHCRWRPRGGAPVDAPPGKIVEFTPDDFDEPGSRPSGALRSLEHVLASGMFAPWDPSQAGDPAFMTRDEMLRFLRSQEVDGDDGQPLPHNATADQLRPIVERVLEERGRERRPRRKRGEG